MNEKQTRSEKGPLPDSQIDSLSPNRDKVRRIHIRSLKEIICATLNDVSTDAWVLSQLVSLDQVLKFTTTLPHFAIIYLDSNGKLQVNTSPDIADDGSVIFPPNAANEFMEALSSGTDGRSDQR